MYCMCIHVISMLLVSVMSHSLVVLYFCMLRNAWMNATWEFCLFVLDGCVFCLFVSVCVFACLFVCLIVCLLARLLDNWLRLLWDSIRGRSQPTFCYCLSLFVQTQSLSFIPQQTMPTKVIPAWVKAELQVIKCKPWRGCVLQGHSLALNFAADNWCSLVRNRGWSEIVFVDFRKQHPLVHKITCKHVLPRNGVPCPGKSVRKQKLAAHVRGSACARVSLWSSQHYDRLRQCFGHLTKLWRWRRARSWKSSSRRARCN